MYNRRARGSIPIQRSFQQREKSYGQEVAEVDAYSGIDRRCGALRAGCGRQRVCGRKLRSIKCRLEATAGPIPGKIRRPIVSSYDKWFDAYARQWGVENNVKVTVQYISYADLNSTLAAAIAAHNGPTLMQMNATPAAFIQGLQPLNDINEAAKTVYGTGVEPCTHQTYLPVKQEWYGYCEGWVVDPGDYRISLWKAAGYPQGPTTYDDLLKGGQAIYQKTGIPVGVGMSPEIDSEFYARSLIWSFGGQVQDACGNVMLNSPQVIDAVKYQAKLFKSAETPEVFSWNA